MVQAPKLPARALHMALTRAISATPAQVQQFIMAAGPDYLKQRTAEAMLQNDTQLAFILAAVACMRCMPAEPSAPPAKKTSAKKTPDKVEVVGATTPTVQPDTAGPIGS